MNQLSVLAPAGRAAGAASVTLWLRARLASAALLVGALLAAAGPAQPAAAAEFLEPDQAFRLSARSGDGAQVELTFDIADGYYLYRERLAVEAAPASVQLGATVYPPGKVKFDETFQKDVETYRQQLRVPVPVSAAPAEFKLAVTSQGCADAGLCYPPRQQVLKVQVADGAVRRVELMADEAGQAWQPAEAAAQPIRVSVSNPSLAVAPRSGEVSIDAALQSGSLWLVAGVFLIAGLLLSFTPCVLPMVPILSSIIVGQGAAASRWRGLALSATYALGMALVYTLFGVAAGLAGEGLAAALQTPWVLGAFAALLVALSLSMFGLYELQLPSSLQSRLSAASGRFAGGRHVGVFAMGGLSALIVGPCVAAPLAGALVYISQTRDVLLGGLALFALACGMSVPLLLVGASAGSLLPRAGGWMDAVKRAFGVLLLGVALWMVTPVLPTWAQMVGWGLLALLGAVLLGLFDRLPERGPGVERLAKGLGLVLALVGTAQFVGVLSGGRSVLQPLAHLATAAADPAGGSTAPAAVGQSAASLAAYRRVKTVEELDQIVRSAGKPVMLDFYADWCVSCKEFEQFTFPDPRVQAKLAGALLLQADVTANDAADRALLKRFGLFGPPGILFFDPQGREQASARVIGYQDAGRFLRSLDAAGL
jgi:thiol:disulfide interchange protein DsbD